MQDPIETSELLAFAKTVDAKSLSRAASELGVPRATISRRLARLEERLSVRLLRRTTRRLVLTDAGEAFYRHARLVLDAVEGAEASVRKGSDAVRGDVRISVPPVHDHLLYEILSDFAKRYPEVRLHVHVSSEHVDLVRGGFDVALRAGHIEPGLVARTLVRLQQLAVAAPEYLAEHGTPRTRADLKKHRCLSGFERGSVPQTYWPAVGGGRVRIEPALVSNELALVLIATLRGLGVACLPSQLVEPYLESGELVHVLPQLIRADVRIAVVYADREFVPPQVRALVDTITSWRPESKGPAPRIVGSQRAEQKPSRRKAQG